MIVAEMSERYLVPKYADNPKWNVPDSAPQAQRGEEVLKKRSYCAAKCSRTKIIRLHCLLIHILDKIRPITAYNVILGKELR